jgi:hypothetical protein
MSRNDISVHLNLIQNAPAIPFATEAASSAIVCGEPVKLGGTGNNFVVLLANGDPEISADVVAGVASTDSTHTASANGVVDVVLPNTAVWSCKATTPANVNTAAELLAILNDRVTFDLAAGVFTVDENEGDDSDHGLRIVGGNINTGDIYFIFRTSGTFTN